MTSHARARAGWKFLLFTLLASVFALSAAPVAHGAFPAEADTTTGSTTGSTWGFSRAERCLMRKINRIRARHGLGRLRTDKQLGYVARRHAGAMAGSGRVWHDSDVGMKVTRWRRLAQNSGCGSTCKSLTRALMRSSTHRANILGRFRYIGVGARRSGGELYVQQLFESRRDPGNIYGYPSG